jgi:RTX calcium-binding nonapeptide repeat (4 copies)
MSTTTTAIIATAPITYSDSAVGSQLFGANMLFMRDFKKGELHQNPNMISKPFSNAIDDLSVGTLRYPGGTVTEELFDLFDPNSNFQTNTAVMGLSSFLTYCAESNRSMTITLPTMRFLGSETDGQGMRKEAVDFELVKAFITQLLTDALSKGVNVSGVEIGNEWYVDGAMTAVEYGRIASKMASAVGEAIDQFREGHSLDQDWAPPEIIVQVGQGGSAERGGTQAIFEEFNSEELSYVDGIVTHRYLNGVWINGWAYDPFDTWSDLASALGDNRDFTRYVTEWNVCSRHTSEIGLRSASSLIALFSEMVVAGVDQASVWAICQNNNQNLTISTGLPGDFRQGLSINGEAFRLLSESVQGKHHVDINGSSVGSAEPGASSWVEVYSGGGETVVFVSERSGSASQFEIDLGGLTEGYTHLWATKIGVADGVDPLDPNAIPVITVLSEHDLLGDHGILFQLMPWEVVRITFTIVDEGVFMSGQRSSDIMEGSYFDDRIFGCGGADTITGGGLDDAIHGGVGADLLFGGRGSDKLIGGRGDDVLSGSDDNDAIFGGQGNDRIFGGEGSDRLEGGLGFDAIFGGDDRSVDTFVFTAIEESLVGEDRDTIFLFNPRFDVLDIQTLDANTSVDGNQEFVWGGFASGANSVWLTANRKGIILSGDVNGDAVADFEVYFGDSAVPNQNCIVL